MKTMKIIDQILIDLLFAFFGAILAFSIVTANWIAVVLDSLSFILWTVGDILRKNTERNK